MAQKLNVAELRIGSPSFEQLGRIPERYSDDGDGLSPALEWAGVPAGTRSFAIVVNDPDPPLVEGFTHWVLYGLPGEARAVAEGGGGEYVSGTNSSGSHGYLGPAPPPGHGPHHYYFWVYALDTDEDVPPGLDRRALLDRIEDHVIEQARVIGLYER